MLSPPPAKRALSAAAALSELNERLGAPRSLRELGLREDQLDEAVELVGETVATLPDPFPTGQIGALVRAAFAGERLWSRPALDLRPPSPVARLV